MKAKRAGDWQLNIEDFAGVTFVGDKQIIGTAKPAPVPGLVYVFVHIASYGHDEFFIIDWPTLRDRIVEGHRAWLAEHGGRRPKNPTSMHTTISVGELADCRNRWDLINDRIGHAA